MKDRTKKIRPIEVDEDLSETPKIRTTMFLDLKLKQLLKVEAKKRGVKYQQLIREILFDFFRKDDSLERRVERLEALLLGDRLK